MLNVAFICGSSRHGNSLRASVDSSCVTNMYLQRDIKDNVTSDVWFVIVNLYSSFSISYFLQQQEVASATNSWCIGVSQSNDTVFTSSAHTGASLGEGWEAYT